jgi:hypothetical protein
MTAQEKVLAYVRDTPNCTARDVAREVFNGSGDTRTKERAKAWRVLSILEGMGHVKRKRPRGDYQRGTADRWSVVE